MHHPEPFDPHQCQDDFDESAAQVGLGAAFLGPIGGRVGAVAAYALHELGKEVCDQAPLDIEVPSYIGGKIGNDPQHDPVPAFELHDPDPHHELDSRAALDDTPSDDHAMAEVDDAFDYDAAQADDGPGFDYATAAADYDSGGGSASDAGDSGGSDAG